MTRASRAKSNVQYLRAPTALSRKVKRPGGLWREQAIAAAIYHLESVKQEYLDDIHNIISHLEEILTDRSLTRGQMLDRLDEAADTMINVAGTFQYGDLAQAAMCLCDLTRGLRLREKHPSDVLAIPLDTIRLLSPRAEPLDARSRDRLLDGLYALRAFIGESAQPA